MTKARLILTVCTGLMVTVALFGQAAPAMGQWMVNGTTLNETDTKALADTAAVDEDPTITAAGTTLQCIGSHIRAFLGTLAGAVITKLVFKILKLESCSANATCTIPSTIETVPLVGHAALDSGSALAAVFTLLPETKSVIATIKFNGAECALLGTQQLQGILPLLAPTGQMEQTLQAVQANVLSTSGLVTLGGTAAAVKGSFLLQLANGQRWSFL